MEVLGTLKQEAQTREDRTVVRIRVVPLSTEGTVFVAEKKLQCASWKHLHIVLLAMPTLGMPWTRNALQAHRHSRHMGTLQSRS